MYRSFTGNKIIKVSWCQILRYIEYSVEGFQSFPEIIWYLRPEITWPNYFGNSSGDNDKYGLEEDENGGKQTSEEAVTKTWVIIVQEVKETKLRSK